MLENKEVGNQSPTNTKITVEQETVEELMKDFVCDPETAECGAKCCSNILLLSEKEIARIKNYIGRNNIKPLNRHNIFSDKYNDKCPFLDDQTLRCRIYEVRPEICKKFTCNMYRKVKPSIPNYRNKKPVNMLLTFSPDSYCPNAPDLNEINKSFKSRKRQVYGIGG